MSTGSIRISVLIALLTTALLGVPAAATGESLGPVREHVEATSDAPVRPLPTSTPDIDASPVPEDVKNLLDRTVQSAPSPTADARPAAEADVAKTPAQRRSSEVQPIQCQDGMAGVFPCRNVDLESMVPLGSAGAGSGNDVWGWTDPKTDREYALVGSALETTFIDVTDPQDPRTIGSLPTAEDAPPNFVLWRDIKVDGNWAFIVSEILGHGMQVFDLTRLRDPGPVPQVFTADVVYRGADDEGVELGNAHNISINEETDVAYVVGSNTCSSGPGGQTGGLHMVDISDPENPAFLNCALVTDPPEHNYAHDVQCVVYRGPDADYQGREICFGSNEEVVTIYDVTDKSNPIVISQRNYPEAAYTHQGWLSPDERFFVFGDEGDEQGGTVDNTTTYIMDALDLDDPRVPKAFAHETTAIDHNLYIDNGLVYEANYGAGLRILDFNNSSLANGQLNEVGFFDIRPGPDPPEFVGAWSNYPFFDSGTVVMTGIEEGSTVLYVLRPTGRATSGEDDKDKDNDNGDGDGDNDKGDGDGGDPDSRDERSPSDFAEDGGGALAVTGVGLMLFVLIGLSLIGAGSALQRLRSARGGKKESRS